MNNIDQFYTNDNIALYCYNILLDKINKKDYDIFLEPSAGNGSFYKLFDKDKRLGIDIDPKYDEIIKMDFFDFKHDKTKKYISIGNPPFGKISSLAIKFFNKCAEFSDCIAFIIPRTFKRVSAFNKLDLNFHLIYSEDLPLKPCCFTPNMNAKCCFQIWKRSGKKENPRNIIVLDNTHPDFTFLKYGPKDDNNQPTPPNGADFVMKAYGSNCGEIKLSKLHKLRPKSWHWIKSNIDKDMLIKRFNSLDYSISKDTVRQDSIGQKEVIWLYKEKY
jgi:hypothetical protein